jgi:putative tryptophan/tyrosine transport system substrate-binding protein
MRSFGQSRPVGEKPQGRISRVAVTRESAVAAGPGQFAAIQAAAAPLGIDLRPIDPRDPSEIEHAIAAFAHEPNGGLIVTGSSVASNHRKLIFALAARHRLPVVYNARFYVSDGGLISYGPDATEQYRRAGGYIDRILRGERPADLPVQAPTKYELVINLKTAKTLGLDIPPTLLARADEVIE